MNTTEKFWIVLIGAILGMAIIACSCGSITPTPTVAPPPTVHPMPELAGYWQDGPKVFTIEWQGNQYVVSAMNSAGAGTRTLTSQSWNGNSLTWTYNYTDETSNNNITYSTVSIAGNILSANYLSSSGASTIHHLQRVSSSTPAYYSLPYNDDFSSPNSGWDVYNTDQDSAGYGSGFYFVISKTNQFSSFGAAGRFYGDTVIEVDATPVSGPTDNNFSYNVGCRAQANNDGYLFEVSADGTYAAGYYTGGGKTYTSLLSGSEWQASSAIKKGMVTNHLAVTCAGNQFKMEVNGQVLYQGQDSTFTSGDITLGAATYDDKNTPAEIHFNNLTVTAP